MKIFVVNWQSQDCVGSVSGDSCAQNATKKANIHKHNMILSGQNGSGSY